MQYTEISQTNKDLVKFLASLIGCIQVTTGRDRFNRFIQYACKLLISLNSDKELNGKLMKVMGAMSMTRKTLFLGKSLEFFTAAQTSLKITDDFARVLDVLKMVGMGLWMMFDNQVCTLINEGLV
jgi:Peroxisomal biogenesis factor 11 (PEX11)